MQIIVLTPVRLLGDGLASCFKSRQGTTDVAVLNDLSALRDALRTTGAQIVLVDVTQGIDLFDVRAIALEWPGLPLVALGLTEHKQDVIKCGRAGFVGYVAREATIEGLYNALSDIHEGKLACPPEISGGLLRALFRKGPLSEESLYDPALTKRESEVLALLGQGSSNKEIGNQLCLSVATVKHHVHNILEKLGFTRRAEAMRRVRDAPWLGRAASIAAKKTGA